jgi:hypothetical protein
LLIKSISSPSPLFAGGGQATDFSLPITDLVSLATSPQPLKVVTDPGLFSPAQYANHLKDKFFCFFGFFNL